MKQLKCPLCDEEMKFKKHKRTDAWICKKCPAVLFEYYSKINIKDLENIIT